MAIGLNSPKFGTPTRKRRVSARSVTHPFDAAILNMRVDSRSMFRRKIQGIPPPRENPAMDDVFHELLSDANRDLARLLRDVRTEPQGSVLGDDKGQQVSDLLMRAVRCAAKQYMLQAELGSLALTDELTSLYNRRGFMAMAERQLRLGRRTGRGMLLFMMDVDGLKTINDAFGHCEGDAALKRVSEVLEQTFRDSDVVARLGGDEFAVLAIEAAGHCEHTIKARLFQGLKSINSRHSRYDISLSFGVARFDPRNGISIEELLAKADQSMYEQKRHRPALVLETETAVASD